MSTDIPPWRGIRILPLVVVDRATDVDVVVDALGEAGLPAVEIALRTPSSLEALSRAVSRGTLTVAAGTVTSPELVQRAKDAGAHFGVSPSAPSSLLDAVHAAHWPFVPGVATPTESHYAWTRGFEVQKLYPITTLGGLAHLDALHAVFPEIRYVPSGGVTADSADEYLAHPAVAAVSGSWLVPKNLIRSGDAKSITALAREWSNR